MYVTIKGIKIKLSDFLLFLSLLFVSSTLPISGKPNSISIIVAVIVLLFYHFSTQFKMVQINIFISSALVFFFLYLVSSILSVNSRSGMFELEKKLSVLFIPLIFTLKNAFSIRSVKWILYAFVSSSLLYVCFYLLRLYFHNPLETIFFVEKDGFNIRRALDMYYGIHPTYISMYLLFASTILYYSASKIRDRYLTILFYLVSLFFYGLIFSLGSRIVIISTIVTMFIFFVLDINRQNITKKIVLLISLILIFLIVYKLTPSMQHRFDEVLSTPKTGPYTKLEMNSTNIRFAILHCSKVLNLEVNYFSGFGVGDAQDKLNQCFEESGWTSDILNYDFHNQYMQTYFELGLIGLVSLLALFIIPTVIGIREKNYLLLIFLVQFGIISSTESTLANQQGVVFFIFMTCLLLKFKDDDLKITLR